MAQVRRPIHDDGPVNAGEKRLLDFLDLKLPSNYIIIPNLNLAITGQNRVMKYWEYDCIVVAPHAVYHIENKDWGGNLEGDDVFEKYYIDEKTDNVSNSGYTTTLKLNKVSDSDATVLDAIDRLAKLKISVSPEYWVANYKNIK